jgi:hypothetical protein
MKTPRSLVVLTAVNCALLLLALAQQGRPAFAQSDSAVLRSRALEIVDSRNRVRASIAVLAAGKSANREDPAETVPLRLIARSLRRMDPAPRGMPGGSGSTGRPQSCAATADTRAGRDR